MNDDQEWITHCLQLVDQITIPGTEHIKEQVRGFASRNSDLRNNADAARLVEAIKVLPQIISDFGITAIESRLSWEKGAKLALAVQSVTPGSQVLKVGGGFDRPKPFEGAVMSAFREKLPSTPKVIKEQLFKSKGRSVLAIMLERLGPQLSGFAHTPPLKGFEEAKQAAREVARLLREAHQADIPNVPLKSVANEIAPQFLLAWSLVEKGELAHFLPSINREALVDQLSVPLKVALLHGDLCGENLVKLENSPIIEDNLALIDQLAIQKWISHE